MSASFTLRLALFLGGLAWLLPAQAQFFADVPQTDRHSNLITDVAYQRLMEGYPDGKFHPEDPLRRAELVMVSARLLNISLKGFMVLPGEERGGRHFPDVPAGHWMNAALGFLTEHGMLAAPDDRPFGPQEPVTNGEFLVQVYRVLHAGASATPEQAKAYLADISALQEGWDGALSAPATRRDVAVTLDNLLVYLIQNAVTEGTIARFDADEYGNRWAILETAIGECRVNLPVRGVLVVGGTPDDLKIGARIRTLSDAVNSARGVYYRVREATLVQMTAQR